MAFSVRNNAFFRFLVPSLRGSQGRGNLCSVSNDDTKAIRFSAADEAFMRRALTLAEEAASHDEVPIGAVVVLDGEIIAEGYNLTRTQCDPTAHAEIVALRRAAKKVNNYRLLNATIYATLEPCAMCAGALVQARVERLVYGARDHRFGGAGSIHNIADCDKLNHRVLTEYGLFEEASTQLLQRFFQSKRS